MLGGRIWIGKAWRVFSFPFVSCPLVSFTSHLTSFYFNPIEYLQARLGPYYYVFFLVLLLVLEQKIGKGGALVGNLDLKGFSLFFLLTLHNAPLCAPLLSRLSRWKVVTVLLFLFPFPYFLLLDSSARSGPYLGKVAITWVNCRRGQFEIRGGEGTRRIMEYNLHTAEQHEPARHTHSTLCVIYGSRRPAESPLEGSLGPCFIARVCHRSLDPFASKTTEIRTVVCSFHLLSFLFLSMDADSRYHSLHENMHPPINFPPSTSPSTE